MYPKCKLCISSKAVVSPRTNNKVILSTFEQKHQSTKEHKTYIKFALDSNKTGFNRTSV